MPGSIEFRRFTNIWLILYFFWCRVNIPAPLDAMGIFKTNNKKKSVWRCTFLDLWLECRPWFEWLTFKNRGDHWGSTLFVEASTTTKRRRISGFLFQYKYLHFWVWPPPLRMQGRNIWRFSSTPEKQDPLIKPQPTCIDMNVVHDQWSYFRRWCWFLTDSTMVNHH